MASRKVDYRVFKAHTRDFAAERPTHERVDLSRLSAALALDEGRVLRRPERQPERVNGAQERRPQ